MADTKISGLSSAGALGGTEAVPIVQSSATVKTTVQDIANLATSTNLGNTNLTSTDNTRTFKLNGDTSSNTFDVLKNAGNILVRFRGDGRMQLATATMVQQTGTGTYQWRLGGATASDLIKFETSAATSVLEVRGSNIVTSQTGSIQVGTAVDNTTIKIRATSSTTNNPVQENSHSGANSLGYRSSGSATAGSCIGYQANNSNAVAVIKTAFQSNVSGSTLTNGNIAFDVLSSAHFKFPTSGGTKLGTATTQLIGFWNTTPISQPSAMTTQLTNLSGDITPSTPDYVLTATNGGWGCGSQDEFETMTSVIENLQTRVQELEDALSTAAGGVGLIA